MFTFFVKFVNNVFYFFEKLKKYVYIYFVLQSGCMILLYVVTKKEGNKKKERFDCFVQFVRMYGKNY